MSGSTKYKEKGGRGAKLTIKISLATRRRNPPIEAIRSMIVERNELLQDQCKVDIEQELARLLDMGSKHGERFKANAAYRNKRRKAIEKHSYRLSIKENQDALLTKKQEREHRMAEIRRRRNNAAEQWEDAEKALLALILKQFPNENMVSINVNGVARHFDATTSIHYNIQIKDKYIAMVHANDSTVSMLTHSVHAVDFSRQALDFWNNELFGDECNYKKGISYEFI